MKRAPVKPVKLTAEQIKTIEEKVFLLVESQLDARFFLVAVGFEKEAGYWYLRLYLEGQGFRISLNDCEAVSRSLDELIETVPELRDIPYSFEVSSPGLFRPLKTQREFNFYQGQPVLVQEISQEMPKNKKMKVAAKTLQEGILLAYDSERNLLKLQPEISADKMVEWALDDTCVVYLNPEVRMPDSEEKESDTPEELSKESD